MSKNDDGIKRGTMLARLEALLRTEWVTPIDALNKVQCLSLSQRCGNLRTRGLDVTQRWVDLPNGKRVMAYHIVEAA